MVVARIEGLEDVGAGRVVTRVATLRRRRRFVALLVSGAVACAAVGYGTVQAGEGSSTPSGWDAWSDRLEGQAEAYFAQQANLARGRAADAARLQAAADAYADGVG